MSQAVATPYLDVMYLCENVDLDEFYDIYDNEEENITEDSIVWVNTNKPFGKEGSLKSLSVKCQRMPNI